MNSSSGSQPLDNTNGYAIISATKLIDFSPSFDTYRFEQLSEQSAAFAKSKYIHNKVKQYIQPILWRWNEMLYDAIGVTIFDFQYNSELEKCSCKLYYDNALVDLNNMTSGTFFIKMKKQLADSPDLPFSDLANKLIDTVPIGVADKNPAAFSINFLSSTMLYTLYMVLGNYLTEELDFEQWCKEKQAVFLSTGELWISNP